MGLRRGLGYGMLGRVIPEEVTTSTRGWVRWLGVRAPSHLGPVRLRVRPIKRGRDGSTPSGSTPTIRACTTNAKAVPCWQSRLPADQCQLRRRPCLAPVGAVWVLGLSWRVGPFRWASGPCGGGRHARPRPGLAGFVRALGAAAARRRRKIDARSWPQAERPGSEPCGLAA
jgi:hypothetical protein